MGDLIQFRPRTNHEADRAFWIGPEPDPMAVLAYEIMNQTFPDTAQAEYVAPPKDSA